MEGKVDEDTTKVEFTVDGKPVYTYIQHGSARKMWQILSLWILAATDGKVTEPKLVTVEGGQIKKVDISVPGNSEKVCYFLYEN